MAHVRSFLRRRSQGRLTEWFGSADATAFTSLGAGTFTFHQEFAAPALAKRPFTIMRTVGSIWVGSDQVAAAEQPFGAMGFQIVSEKAATTGATALSDPITEEDSDAWYTYKAFAAQGGPIQGNPWYTYDFDSRGQRRVEDGFTFALMVSNASAAFGMNFLVKFRMIVKLS